MFMSRRVRWSASLILIPVPYNNLIKKGIASVAVLRLRAGGDNESQTEKIVDISSIENMCGTKELLYFGSLGLYDLIPKSHKN
jgi:hypothetical protein